MKKSAFCEYCFSEREYQVYKVRRTSILKEEEVSYKAKEAVCNVCGNEIFVSDICDYNLMNLYKEYRRNYNIISTDEIQKVKIKYSINSEALSLILGWNSKTIERYLDGDMIGVSNSDLLRKVYENASYYSIILQNNKERINPVDYNKSRQAIRYILAQDQTEEKIDAVIKYLLIRCEDFTALSIQKLLYYVQAFHYVFTGNFMFEEDCEAWKDGPFYRSLYERYEQFGYEKVNKDILANDKLRLENFERNIVESIIKFYGCYSGKILKEMTKSEAPWILTRTNSINGKSIKYGEFNTVIEKSLIQEYFDSIKEKYNISSVLDIQNYSRDLFDKISI
ncbi:type II toxin-antitoxin system antitoxin SocA domain-containing protein [Clostridium beijerinckii]|uniref:Phage-associated protein n=1 Tax=Clostridium beijerinckii TaxID=1520 RepID=A0AAX0B0A2_CLOBE|nr:type II toxin-antitoxin system antitoxin SocA domain-containing protein [Clostridium beijerinckii]NRT88506.1 putative phage-associated protein [Clostridium beijerinckii]NYC73961.1 putative phage-associated protein [Clostridium beijerinckii]